MPDLLVVLILIGPAVVPALALAYWPRRRRPGPPHAGIYRGTPVDWPRPPLRPHPRFERPSR